MAIADDDGLGRIGVPATDLGDEFSLRAHDVGERLAGLGMRPEDHEIDGMAVAERHPDLTVALEGADACAVPGARIDDHIGALFFFFFFFFQSMTLTPSGGRILSSTLLVGRGRVLPSMATSWS